DDATGAAWTEAARAALGPSRVTTAFTVEPALAGAAPWSIAPWLTALLNGPEDTAIRAQQGAVRVTGSVADDPTAARFLDAVRAAAPPSWSIEDGLTRVGEADVAAVEAALETVLALGPIAFETNSASLTAEGQRIVQRAAQALRTAPSLQIAVEGHTDSSGSEPNNVRLSQARAETVVAALATLGVEPARLTAEGFGSRRPIADNATPEGRRINRRIEFRVRQGDTQ
ncbi:MAG: OmpA family protein, partial [Acidobacteriota bacterium]